MRVFVRQSGQRLGLRVTGSEQDFASATDAQSRRNLLGKLNGNTLLPNELHQCVQVLGRVPLDAGGGRKTFAVGLLQIEDENGSESVNLSPLFPPVFGLVLVGFFLADDRSENLDSLLPLANVAAEGKPRLETAYVRRGRALLGNE